MADYNIKNILARQTVDCKCRPMVEVDVILEGGAKGRGSAPTGSSVGKYESYVLRDNNPREYEGMSVHCAVNNVTDIIAPALIGMDIRDLHAIDYCMIELDKTRDKHNLGGNAIYSTSIACFRALAAYYGIEPYRLLAGENIKTVPIPSFNVINGGKYSDVIQSFNEFIIMPYRADNIDHAVEMGIEVFKHLENTIEQYTKKPAQVGKSFGYTAPSNDPEIILDLISETIDRLGFNDRFAFALDCASSEFYDEKNGTYLLKGQRVTSDELIQYAKMLTEKYNFVFIEDLLDEDDWNGYEKAHKILDRTLIIGDDFCVSNKERIKEAYNRKCIDGFILKPNQVGTITEALEAHRFGTEHGLLSITSGRSGGVVNDIVMDLAVGLQIPFIKNGCPRSGERIDKLNFLIRANSLNDGCRLSDISNLVKFH